jgi:hypothetical protein
VVTLDYFISSTSGAACAYPPPVVWGESHQQRQHYIIHIKKLIRQLMVDIHSEMAMALFCSSWWAMFVADAAWVHHRHGALGM